MARATLILAKSPREAQSYAKLVGLRPFTYRFVTRAAAIRGIRNAEVHILPSFILRIDRHGILATLRNAKLDVYYVDPADLVDDSPEPQQAPEDLAAEVLPNGSQTGWESEGGAPLPDPSDDGTVTFQIVAPSDRDTGHTEAELAAMSGANDPDLAAPIQEAKDSEPTAEEKAEEPERKRRYRCKVCDQLVWNDADPEHDADAHATEAALQAEPPVRAASDVLNFFGS